MEKLFEQSSKCEALKKGDIVYCIKDFGWFERYNFDENDIKNSELRSEYKNPDGTYKDSYLYFKAGRRYVVIGVLSEIFDGLDGCDIECEAGTDDEIVSQGFQTDDNKWKVCKDKDNDVDSIIASLYGNSFSEYFVDKIGYRKIKLDELSDVNFSDFLGSIKRKKGMSGSRL